MLCLLPSDKIRYCDCFNQKSPAQNELTIVNVSDLGVLVLARFEVGHQRRDVLRRRQPRVHVSPRVEETAGGDGDVGDLVTVEGEAEAEWDGGGPAVRLGQHRVLLDVSRGPVQLIQVDESVDEVFRDA